MASPLLHLHCLFLPQEHATRTVAFGFAMFKQRRSVTFGSVMLY